MAIATVNPATAELLAIFEPLSETATKEKLQLAAETFRIFRRTSFTDDDKDFSPKASLPEPLPFLSQAPRQEDLAHGP